MHPRQARAGLTKKMMDGEAARALRNISLTARSDSPTYLFSSCPGQSELTSTSLLWGATATATTTHLWTLDGDKVETALRGQRFRRHGLTASRWAIQ